MKRKIIVTALASFLSCIGANALADSYVVEFVASSLPDNLGQYRIANVEATVTPDTGVVGLFRSHDDVGLLNGWATFIWRFEASDENGNSLTPEFLGEGRWKLDGWKNGPVKLNYTMLLQHDRFPNDPGVDEVAYARAYGVMWTGRALFMGGVRSLSEIDVRFEAPKAWRFTTPWNSVSSDNHRFVAQNTDELLDSAFMGGEHIEEVVSVAGNEARLALAPPLESVHPVMVSTLEDSLAAYERLFGVGMDEALLVIVGDAPYSGGGVMGRTISIVLGDDENNRPDYIVAHEGFHIWGAQWNLRQTNGEMEWLKEGLAEYYTAVIGVRTGRISVDGFVEEWEQRSGTYLTELKNDSIAGGGAGKLQSMSSYNLVYSGGMMLCAALDAEIRKLSHGARSLDDFIDDIHARHAGAENAPLSIDVFSREMEAEFGIDAKAFFDAYLFGRTALPIEDIFALYGLGASISETDDSVEVELRKMAPNEESERFWNMWTQAE